MRNVSRGSGFSLSGTGLALVGWAAERAGLKLPAWLLVPVFAVAGLMIVGGLFLVARDHLASRRVASQGPKDAATHADQPPPAFINARGVENLVVEGNLVTGRRSLIDVEESSGVRLTDNIHDGDGGEHHK
jgi:hypothetical protein